MVFTRFPYLGPLPACGIGTEAAASEAEAEQLGGTLAVIESVGEQEWVFATFGSYGGTNRIVDRAAPPMAGRTVHLDDGSQAGLLQLEPG
jgi:hypothetical protein